VGGRRAGSRRAARRNRHIELRFDLHRSCVITAAIFAMIVDRSAALARESATNIATATRFPSGAVRIPTSFVAAVRPFQVPLVPVLWETSQPASSRFASGTVRRRARRSVCPHPERTRLRVHRNRGSGRQGPSPTDPRTKRRRTTQGVERA
jgi:hypothetical protein